MKQQVLFFFFTLMLTGISVSAQTGGGRIAGVVIDNAGEEPLPGATIFIEELKKGIVTDGHGEFLLSDVPAATYTLTVRFIGYHTLRLCHQHYLDCHRDVLLQLATGPCSLWGRTGSDNGHLLRKKAYG